MFTVPHTSTPCLGEIYKHATDGTIPDEGLTGPSVIGCLPAEEKAVQEEIENPGKYHEQIVRDWGFNFNDSPFPKKKRNLYHVIYTGEHTDHIYSDLADPA